jgi:hypothetical protein
MTLLRTIALLLFLVAPAQVVATSLVHQADVVVRGENDPLDAPLSDDLSARLHR